jgi:hypothetical protein
MRCLVLFGLMFALVSTGCSKQSTPAGQSTPNTSAADQKAAALEASAGTAQIGIGKVDAAKLGVPIYPGATAIEGGGLNATTAEGSAQILVLTTNDAFTRVYSWYQAKLPAGSEKAHTSTADSSFASFEMAKNGDKEISAVELSTDNGKTQIAISHGSK